MPVVSTTSRRLCSGRQPVIFFCAKQILLPKTLQESLGIAVTLAKWFHAAVGMWWWAMPTPGHAHMIYLAVWLETEGGTWFPEGL